MLNILVTGSNGQVGSEIKSFYQTIHITSSSQIEIL